MKHLFQPKHFFFMLLAWCMTYVSVPSYTQNADVKRQTAIARQESLIHQAKEHLQNLDTAKAMESYRKAFYVADSLSEPKLMIETLIGIGTQYYQTGQFLKGKAHLLRAYELAKMDGRKLEMAIALENLAHIDWRLGNNIQSIEQILGSIEIFHILNDTTHLVSANGVLAGVHVSLRKFDEAKHLYNEMFIMAKQKKDSVLLAKVYEYFGVVNFFQAQYDSALYYYQLAFKINASLGAQLDGAINLGNIAEVYDHRFQYKLAIEHFDMAIAIEKKFGFKSGLIFLYYGKGHSLTMLGKYKEAIELYHKALQLIEETGEFRERPQVLALMADNYRLHRKFEDAYVFYKEYVTIKDSIDNLDKNRQFEEIKARFELGKRERENSLLTTENIKSKAELDANRRVIMIQRISVISLAIFLIALLTLLILLARKRERLRKANFTKDLLIRVIGHDLRGPVGNMRTMIDFILLEKVVSQSEELKGILRSVRHSVDNTFNVMNNLLAWAGIQKDGLKFSPKNVNLHQKSAEAIELLRYSIDSKNIHIVNNVPEEHTVYVDEEALHTILRNLIANAIKFTPKQGSVTIHSEALSEKFIKVSVIDTGIGIKAEHLPHIFSDHVMNSTYGTEFEKGNGIGLTICKDFVENSGGKMGVISQEGVGSQFYFTLPVCD